MAAALVSICHGAQNLFFSGKPGVLHRAVHTSVWWDMNSVRAPKGCDFSTITGNITDALAKLNYSAPVSFSAYGQLYYLLDQEEIDALSRTGVQLTDSPFGYYDPEVSSVEILRDSWFWTKEHPAPANCLFITDHRDMSFVLHQLGMKGYNILLARSKGLPGEIEAAAKTIWRWKSLLAGGPPERTN